MQPSDSLSPVLELTVATFTSAVTDDPTPILIDFWAPWCGPCRAMKPILFEAATSLTGKVRVAQVNVDDEPSLAQAFNVRSIPTCVLIKAGQPLDVFIGVVPAQVLVGDILALLGESPEASL
jgi:thioredoxin